MKSQDTSQLFDNVKVPKETLGDEKMGFKIMMEELARERLTVGISAVATAEGAIENCNRRDENNKDTRLTFFVTV
jgi:alkylation response protein AidB-like acyl-CoA dehydrogenase